MIVWAMMKERRANQHTRDDALFARHFLVLKVHLTCGNLERFFAATEQKHARYVPEVVSIAMDCRLPVVLVPKARRRPAKLQV